MEAMAMELPVIGTNYSGPTEFMNRQNSYLLSVERFYSSVDEDTDGIIFAEPSVLI